MGFAKCWAVLAALLCLAASGLPSDLLVLKGATLLDGTGAPARPDAVVVVQGERILRVGTERDSPDPLGATVIDLRGRYLLPGFIDAHVHVDPEVDHENVGVLQRLEPRLAPPSILAKWGKDWETGNPFVLRNPAGVAQNLTAGKPMFPIAKEIIRTFHERGPRRCFSFGRRNRGSSTIAALSRQRPRGQAA